FAPGRMAAPGQSAGTTAVPRAALRSDDPFGDRRAQSRGHKTGGDDRLYRRFRADADRHPRLIAAVAADPRAAPAAADRGGGLNAARFAIRHTESRRSRLLTRQRLR